MRPAFVVPVVLLALLLAGCTATPAHSGGIYGSAMAGPTCPVQRDPPEPNCADKPYHGQLAVMASDDKTVVKVFETGVDGSFNVTLDPGEYSIRDAAPRGVGSCLSDGFAVREGFTHVAVRCDTGIR